MTQRPSMSRLMGSELREHSESQSHSPHPPQGSGGKSPFLEFRMKPGSDFWVTQDSGPG